MSGDPGLVCGPMITVSTVSGVPSLEDVYDVSEPDSGSHRLGPLATASAVHLWWTVSVSSFFESAMGMPWLITKAEKCRNKIKKKCILNDEKGNASNSLTEERHIGMLSLIHI